MKKKGATTFSTDILFPRASSVLVVTTTLLGFFLLLQLGFVSTAAGQTDDFNRPDNAALGNGWIEKSGAAFSLIGNSVRKAATSTIFSNNLVYRPASEAMLDGEASVEVRFTSLSPGYPQVFVRGQTATIANAGVLDGYLLFIDNATNRALLDRIESGAFFQLAQITINPALNTTDTYRLRLRATGTNPVALEAYIERLSGTSWTVIGQAIYNDAATTRFTTAGTVGFSGHVEGDVYTYDNFTRLTLGGSSGNPVPAISGLVPDSAQVGGPAFTLTVNGSAFVTDSVARWNGEDRPTTFVSATELQAGIPDTDIAAVGTAAVTVFTPGPGGGSSNPGSFAIIEPGTSFFFDDFNRPNSANVGNGWTEKYPPAFSIQNNELVSIDTAPIDYHDTIVYRPVNEDRSDVEVGVEFRLLPGLNFPQVHARVQRDTITQPDTLESYIFFVDGFEPSPGRAIIAVQPPVTNLYECYMRAIPFPSPLQQADRYRLRFQVTGMNPVNLTGIVERFDGMQWQLIASGSTTHDATTQRDPNLYCDPGVMPSPIPSTGAVGFAKWETNNEVLDNFSWRDLSGINPLPTIASLSPSIAQVGGTAFTLTVNGNGFVEGSVVRWNGANRPTALVSSTQLVADISATDIEAAGTVAVTVFTPEPGGGTSAGQTFTITADDPLTEMTVTFDDPTPPGSSGDLLTGVFEGIDFGTGQWRWEGAFGANDTNHIFFDSATGTARTFQFALGPRVLESLRVFAGTAGTLTISDEQGQLVNQTVTPGTMQLIQTDWDESSTTITINFTAGWELGVDDIAYRE